MHERSHCRAHLDHKLGPRNGGAPKGNFHNFKSGRYANPLSPAELKSLAHQLANDPDSLPQHLDAAIHDICGRTVNHLHTLILLARFLNQLLPYCAEIEYTTGLEAFVQGLPPEMRPGVRTQIWRYALPLKPLQRPLLIKAIAKRFPKELFHKHNMVGQHIIDGQHKMVGQDIIGGQDPTAGSDIVDA
jgi:hypothetical protein